MKVKYLFVIACLFVGAFAEADYLDKDGILRSDDGHIRRMNQYDALRACPTGTRLPTAREFAKEAKRLGAKGILELGEVKNGEIPEGYEEISVKNPDGTKDGFYYNSEGYKNPESDLGKNLFWSSSIHADNFNFVFIFYGYYGIIDYYFHASFNDISVRCIAN